MDNPRGRRTATQQAALREQAVRLRLARLPLREVCLRTSLSAPTVIAAYKRFLQGGWEAVKGGSRGRPVRESALTAAEFADLLLAEQPYTYDSSRRLWDHALIQTLLMSKQGVNRSLKTLQRLTQQWRMVSPPPWLLSDLGARNWFESRLPELALWRQKHSATPLVIGMDRWVTSATPLSSLTVVWAYDLRGRLRWQLSAHQPDTRVLEAFFQALLAEHSGCLALAFHGVNLHAFEPLAGWLVQHAERVRCQSFSLPSAGNDFSEMSRKRSSVATTQSVFNSTTRTPMSLTHLQRLEAESMQIMREVVAETENPVMLYSIGKDSAVMLHLAMKAFYPSKPPFPLLHVDTTWKFRDMYSFRDEMVAKCGLELLTHTNPDGLAKGINPFTHGSAIHTDIMKTEALKQALDKYGFDAAFGGARRDEEKSRAKERIFSFRTADHRWDPKNQRPELWKHYNARKHKGESIRIFPLSNWTELDIWQYIHLEQIPIVPLYYSAERPVVERDGVLVMVDDDRMPLKPGEVPMMKKVRFRTLGCYPLTGAVESEADTLPSIIQEMLLTKTSERQGRVIDHDSAASMEKKKQEGYF